MTVTIRNVPKSDIKKVNHFCKLPNPSFYLVKTQASCDFCGQWWKIKRRSVSADVYYYSENYWKKMHKRDRYPQGSE